MPDFANPQDFVQFLRLSNKQWGDDLAHASTWVFRGQADVAWPLVPTAWRDRSINKLDALICRYEALVPHGGAKHEWMNRVWCTAERHALEDFILATENQGVDTTLSPRQHYRIHWSREARDNLKFDENNPMFHDTAAALAQHHGIPTRTMDWTESPMTASFFAANDDSIDSSSGKKLAVFALDLSRLSGATTEPFVQPKPPIRSKNDFLRVQNGLLTEIRGADTYFRNNGKWPTLNDALQTNSIADALEVATLPHAHASELNMILRREGYSKSHLMPTLDNVAAEVISNW